MPWYPLAGKVVEPVVYFGGGGHGLTHNPFVHIGFLGLGSWALHREWAAWWPWGDSPGPARVKGRPLHPYPHLGVQHATAVNP